MPESNVPAFNLHSSVQGLGEELVGFLTGLLSRLEALEAQLSVVSTPAPEAVPAPGTQDAPSPVVSGAPAPEGQ